VIEPARAFLMPHLAEVRRAAKSAGALGMVISGAGPTLCAVCDSPSAAEQAAAAMHRVYSNHAMTSTARHGRVLRQGAFVINRS